MMRTFRCAAILCVAFFGVTVGFAQSAPGENKNLVLEGGVKKHDGLDEIYRQFSEGYAKLDPTLVADLYTESAAYLVPGDEIKVGRAPILESFTRFFDSVKGNRGRLEISFRILQREVGKDLGYDIGIYTLKSFNENGSVSVGDGKFVVVAKRAGKQWQFQVDGYSDLPKKIN